MSSLPIKNEDIYTYIYIYIYIYINKYSLHINIKSSMPGVSKNSGLYNDNNGKMHTDSN